MKSETRLESAVFQLTPTRTRCDLVIKANGKTEKIASGLLNPFLAHLKTAQDQIAKGGYSITLEPDPATDTLWFTKGTVERFVRFVSTPEVLERVNTIESEILQIEEAIAIQGNESLHLGTVEECQSRSAEYVGGGSKSISDADAAKAIVIYKPGAHVPESNGSTGHEENSKVQLLRVLETRKTALQKEQGMAFARATAAGFSMENIAHLISFAECFGASRLLEACLKFMELWKRKHETGQWLEIEAADAMSMQSEFSSINASGIMLSADIGKQKEHREQWLSSNGVESNGKANGDAAGDMNSDPTRDKRISGDSQVPFGSNEYFHGQFPHPMFPPWPVQSPPGAPVFQPYPMQGMPYYQNYPPGGPYFPPAYSPVDNPRFNSQRRRRSKRHSMDSKGSIVESESYEVNTRSQEEEEEDNASDPEKEVSQEWESHRKGGRLGKKRSGMVVIRNLNYITSNKHGNASGSASESASEDSRSDTAERNERSHKKSSRPSKSKENHTNATETLDYHTEEAPYGQEVDSGNWQVFQSFLLRNDEERGTTVDKGMFSGEKEPQMRRRQNKSGTDPILPHERDSGDGLNRRMVDFDSIDGKPIRRYSKAALNDEKFHLNEGGFRDSRSDVPFKEIEGRRGRYKGGTSEDFMVYRQDKFLNRGPSDPLVENEYECAGIVEKGSSYDATDESFIVPVRSGSPEMHGVDNRTAIDMDSEYPSAPHETDLKINCQLSYEPDDLSLMPERGMERESIGYDPALDYDAEVQAENDTVIEKGKQEDAAGTKEGLKTASKEKKLKAAQDGLEKRKMDALLRKGKPSKSSPLADAQARANKLRAFKADLQKVKKEKEEEEIRRLEALKRERQQRIATRGSNAARSSSTPLQKRNQIPGNPYPTSHRGSKFSDSAPGSFSPLQKLHIRTRSVGSADSKKITGSRLDVRKQEAGNGLSRSVSSLPDAKKDADSVTPELKTASVLSRRLSDPRGSNAHSSLLKPTNNDVIPKQNSSDPKGSSKDRASLQGSVSSNQVPKKHSHDEPQSKKVSTLINLDKSKSATQTDLKIRAPRRLPDTVEKMAAKQESAQKGNKSRSLTLEDTKVKKTKGSNQQLNNGDDNVIVEKIVVMLENENVPIPVIDVQDPEHEIETGNGLARASKGVKNEVVSEYAAIRAPPSPIITCENSNNSSECLLDQQPKHYEVNVDYAKDGSTNTDTGVSDKSYQAPYARATSLEDPCTRNMEYIQAPPSLCSGNASIAETIKVHVPCSADSSVEQIHETVEKPRGKESLKGFKKLLKFGRKSHGATCNEPSLELDSSSMDDQAVDISYSNEAHMLKNLISQDDTHVGGTPPKASRHFSILSPFRSKATEKKLVG